MHSRSDICPASYNSPLDRNRSRENTNATGTNQAMNATLPLIASDLILLERAIVKYV